MSPQKKTAQPEKGPAPTLRTGDPCPGPGEEEGQPCGRSAVVHGLCHGHGRQEPTGQQLRQIRKVKEHSDEGAVYRWSISWLSADHADAVTTMAKDSGRGERDFIRFVLEECAKAEGRLASTLR